MVALATGIGASLSNVVGGFVIEYAGYPASFSFFAAAVLITLVFFATLMPETRGAEGPSSAPSIFPREVVMNAPDHVLVYA